MVETCPRFDNPCLFARSIQQLQLVVRTWYGSPLSEHDASALRWKVIWPTDFLPLANAHQSRLLRQTALSLASFLHTIIEDIDMAQRWNNTVPKTADHQSLHSFLGNVCGPFQETSRTELIFTVTSALLLLRCIPLL